VTPWSSGNSTASAAPSDTWSTPSPAWPNAASGFGACRSAIDTTTPGGKLVFHVFAALAEFERDLIHERTTAGLAAAHARGRRGGRPSVLTGHKLQVAEEMYRSGQYTVSAIATTLGVSRASIYRHLFSAGG
jgi:DNA invertase Pin-like site-specific DNA recombinase